MSRYARMFPAPPGTWGRVSTHVARSLGWAAIGVVFGLFLLTASDWGARWVIYFVLGALGIGVLPLLVRLAGSLERFLLIVLVASLQLELDYTPMPIPYKPAGPPGFTLTPMLFAGLGLLALQRRRESDFRGESFESARRLKRWLVTFLVCSLASTLTTPWRSMALFGVWEILTLVIVAAAACYEASTRDGLRTIEAVFLWGLAIQSGLIFVELLMGVQFSLKSGVATTYGWAGAGGGRYAGTLGSPSEAADYLLVCLLLLVGKMFAAKGAVTRGEALLAATGFLAILMTQTREAWIGLAIGAVGLSSYFYRRGSLPGRLLIRLGIVGVLAASLAWPVVSARLAGDHSGDAQTRWNLVQIAVGMIKAHPLTGIGVNTSDHQVSNYARSEGAEGWVFVVHNQFFKIFSEMGLAGFVSFVALFVIAVAASARCAKAGDPLIRNTGVVLFWVLVVLVWAQNLDSIGGVIYKLVFFIIGMACGLECLMRRGEGGEAAAITQKAA